MFNVLVGGSMYYYYCCDVSFSNFLCSIMRKASTNDFWRANTNIRAFSCIILCGWVLGPSPTNECE